jgi:hypothetical protein
MTSPGASQIDKSARHLLADLAGAARRVPQSASKPDCADVAALRSAGLAASVEGGLRITAAGRAYLKRLSAKAADGVDPFTAQHLVLTRDQVRMPDGALATVTRDETESPLSWLARRKGRDGKPLIAPHHLLAGERLRGVFTRSHLMPRTTANWDVTASSGRGNAAAPHTFAEAAVDARRQLRRALAAAGPEFSGLLLDVCCFLKRLEDVERDRGWPARSAKVVLQLALDRLARHYGVMPQAQGRGRAPVRTWLAEDAAFSAEAFSDAD